MQGGRVTRETEVVWKESEKFQGERGTDRRVRRQVGEWMNTWRDLCADSQTDD